VISNRYSAYDHHYSLFMTEYTDGELHYSLGHSGLISLPLIPSSCTREEIQKQV